MQDEEFRISFDIVYSFLHVSSSSFLFLVTLLTTCYYLETSSFFLLPEETPWKRVSDNERVAQLIYVWLWVENVDNGYPNPAREGSWAAWQGSEVSGGERTSLFHSQSVMEYKKPNSAWRRRLRIWGSRYLCWTRNQEEVMATTKQLLLKRTNFQTERKGRQRRKEGRKQANIKTESFKAPAHCSVVGGKFQAFVVGVA